MEALRALELPLYWDYIANGMGSTASAHDEWKCLSSPHNAVSCVIQGHAYNTSDMCVESLYSSSSKS
jgi:hypothetical protein